MHRVFTVLSLVLAPLCRRGLQSKQRHAYFGSDPAVLPRTGIPAAMVYRQAKPFVMNKKKRMGMVKPINASAAAKKVDAIKC